MTARPLSIALGLVAVLCALGLGRAEASDEGEAASVTDEVRAEIVGLEARWLDLLAQLPAEEREQILQSLANRARRLGAAAADSAVTGPLAELPPTEIPPPAVLPPAEPPPTEFSSAQPAEAAPAPVVGEGADGLPEELGAEESGAVELPSEELEVDSVAVEPSPCRPLDSLDSNGDGRVSAGDRYWRHLFAAKTAGELTRERLETLYDAGVRELDFARRSYSNRQSETEDLELSDRVRLVVRRGGESQRLNLVVDASRLERAGATLLAPSGEPLAGYQVLSAGMSLEVEGVALEILCESSPGPRISSP